MTEHGMAADWLNMGIRNRQPEALIHLGGVKHSKIRMPLL
jgi:hypothetical protein